MSQRDINYTIPKGGILCLVKYSVGTAGSRSSRCSVNSTRGVFAKVAMKNTRVIIKQR